MRRAFVLVGLLASLGLLAGCGSAETMTTPPLVASCSPLPPHRRVIGPPVDASFGPEVDVVAAIYLEYSPRYVLESGAPFDLAVVGARMIVANASGSGHFLNVWSSDGSGVANVADGQLLEAEFDGERWLSAHLCKAGADPLACAGD